MAPTVFDTDPNYGLIERLRIQIIPQSSICATCAYQFHTNRVCCSIYPLDYNRFLTLKLQLNFESILILHSDNLANVNILWTTINSWFFDRWCFDYFSDWCHLKMCLGINISLIQLFISNPCRICRKSSLSWYVPTLRFLT